MVHAVIMAGGRGTRFWPESRQEHPKQLLSLLGPDSLIRQTVKRLQPFIPDRNIMVMTSQHLKPAIQEELEELPPENILGEPCGRDTAPCVGLAASYLYRRDPDTIMIALPSDHLIQSTERFQEQLQHAVNVVDAHPETIATFGIKPNFPATVYGYIQRGKPLTLPSPSPVFQVKRFCEKPDQATAQQFVTEKNYYWNCGIFVWKVSTILNLIEQFAPEIHPPLSSIRQSLFTVDEQTTLDREFANMPRISIDHAVMEHAPHICVLEAAFDWEDIGNWEALRNLSEKDCNGNTISGQHCGIQTQDCIIRGNSDTLITTLGVNNLLIVQTPDAILIADRTKQDSLKALNDKLRDTGFSPYL